LLSYYNKQTEASLYPRSSMFMVQFEKKLQTLLVDNLRTEFKY